MRKRITAKTPLELREKIRKAEGWTWKEGEVRMMRVSALYALSVDYQRNCFVATRKEI